ncbi:MAG TPA: hypothetical protein VIK04_16495 [Solirubrobacteraceae bacterium]
MTAIKSATSLRITCSTDSAASGLSAVASISNLFEIATIEASGRGIIEAAI